MQARTTIRETRCLKPGVFAVELLYNAQTIEQHVPGNIYAQYLLIYHQTNDNSQGPLDSGHGHPGV
jgi:hypothetical protein